MFKEPTTTNLKPNPFRGQTLDMRGCNATDHQLDVSKFAGPLPWIGLYVAAASLICALAMLVDACRGFRSRKLWFPCKYFSLNAATLTFIGIATKFPLDLNTSMPGHYDQLTKLSGTVLLCTVIGNFMPSLGAMDDSSITANVLALLILVITVMANIGIQMGTGVIYVFLIEHIIVMGFLVVVLAILVATAFTVPIMKQKMEEDFNSKFNTVLSEGNLKKKVEKFWLMAHTGSPQYVVGRSSTCVASGAFSLFGAVILIEACVRSLLHGSMFCIGDSDYGWSTKVVFYSQVATVVVGTVAPVSRWLNSRRFRSTGSFGDWSCKKQFEVEKYWVKWLEDWKDEALPFDNGSRRRRKITHIFKNYISALFMYVQKGMILLSKFIIRILSILPLDVPTGLYMLMRRWSKRIGNCFTSTDINQDQMEFGSSAAARDAAESAVAFGVTRSRSSGSHELSLCVSPDQGHSREPLDRDHAAPRAAADPAAAEDPLSLRNFVLHLEGEQELVDVITRNEQKDVNRWIEKGEKREPTELIHLLGMNSECDGGFAGVIALDRDQVKSFLPNADEPKSCWAMPIVTLVAIAMALPHDHVDKNAKRSLLGQVYQGLKYVRFVEKHLDGKGLVNARDAADKLWTEIELHYRWFDVDLHTLARNQTRCQSVVSCLADAGKSRFKDSLEEELITDSLKWPGEMHAYYCMYKVATNILEDYNLGQTENNLYLLIPRSDSNLFHWIQVTISDILRACVTNMSRAIGMECICSSIDNREESVRNAAFLLGETKFISDILKQQPTDLTLDENQMAYIDEWIKKILQRRSCVNYIS